MSLHQAQRATEAHPASRFAVTTVPRPSTGVWRRSVLLPTNPVPLSSTEPAPFHASWSGRRMGDCYESRLEVPVLVTSGEPVSSPRQLRRQISFYRTPEHWSYGSYAQSSSTGATAVMNKNHGFVLSL